MFWAFLTQHITIVCSCWNTATLDTHIHFLFALYHLFISASLISLLQASEESLLLRQRQALNKLFSWFVCRNFSPFSLKRIKRHGLWKIGRNCYLSLSVLTLISPIQTILLTPLLGFYISCSTRTVSFKLHIKYDSVHLPLQCHHNKKQLSFEIHWYWSFSRLHLMVSLSELMPVQDIYCAATVLPSVADWSPFIQISILQCVLSSNFLIIDAFLNSFCNDGLLFWYLLTLFS